MGLACSWQHCIAPVLTNAEFADKVVLAKFRRIWQFQNMADNIDPPPLFENVDIKKSEDNNEDLFVSAMQVI